MRPEKPRKIKRRKVVPIDLILTPLGASRPPWTICRSKTSYSLKNGLRSKLCKIESTKKLTLLPGGPFRKAMSVLSPEICIAEATYVLSFEIGVPWQKLVHKESSPLRPAHQPRPTELLHEQEVWQASLQAQQTDTKLGAMLQVFIW